MLSDVIERINIRKVDKCMASAKHTDTGAFPYHVERLVCQIMHIRHPRYTKSMYVFDMVLLTIIHPNRAKQHWAEVRRELS